MDNETPTQSASECLGDEDQNALRFAANGSASLCTIVGIHGSFSRRLGAQLAISRDGKTAGSLADGCLESELVTRSQEALSLKMPMLLRYGHGSPFIDFRLPCGSGIDILVDPVPNLALLRAAVAQLDSRSPTRLLLPRTRVPLIDVRSYMPAMKLLVFGAAYEANMLAKLAASYGVSVDVRTPDNGIFLNQAPNENAVDGWTAVVLLFHDHEWEGAILEWALQTEAFYIGAQGGQVPREQRKHWLKSRGHTDEAILRIRSPIGLIPNTRDARTLALSILAGVVDQYEQLRA
jgi:xanthine dehydrogenase accessory factor